MANGVAGARCPRGEWRGGPVFTHLRELGRGASSRGSLELTPQGRKLRVPGMLPGASPQQAFPSCLPRNAAGKSGRPGSSGSQLSPTLPQPALPPSPFPPSLAKRKANEGGKVSSSPPLLSRQLCRKKAQLQAQTAQEVEGWGSRQGRQEGAPSPHPTPHPQ